MKRTAVATLTALGVLGMSQLLTADDAFAGGRKNGSGGAPITVYVESQGLYYDSFVAAERLPPKGRFQQLDPTGGPHGGPSTYAGPGDHDFVGGRWWVDANPNGEMDAEDVYFSCPLLGPGRAEP